MDNVVQPVVGRSELVWKDSLVMWVPPKQFSVVITQHAYCMKNYIPCGGGASL